MLNKRFYRPFSFSELIEFLIGALDFPLLLLLNYPISKVLVYTVSFAFDDIEKQKDRSLAFHLHSCIIETVIQLSDQSIDS